MPPPLLLSFSLFSALSLFLQSLYPPPPVTATTVDVQVDLHNHPLQQLLACDRQFHCPPPRMQGHEERYQVAVVGGPMMMATATEGGAGLRRCGMRTTTTRRTTTTEEYGAIVAPPLFQDDNDNDNNDTDNDADIKGLCFPHRSSCGSATPRQWRRAIALPSTSRGTVSRITGAGANRSRGGIHGP